MKLLLFSGSKFPTFLLKKVTCRHQVKVSNLVSPAIQVGKYPCFHQVFYMLCFSNCCLKKQHNIAKLRRLATRLETIIEKTIIA